MRQSLPPATLKRLANEARKLADSSDPSFAAAPVGDDLLDWHFSIRGPPDTPFAGGVYHGRIQFPENYPLSPPDLYFLTPNGRFHVNRKICLSVTSFHPLSWSPGWDLSTLLISLIAFLPTKGEGAIGAIDASAPTRRFLAIQSRHWHCRECSLAIDPGPPPPQLPAAGESAEAKAEAIKVPANRAAPFEAPVPPAGQRRIPRFLPLLDVPIAVLVCFLIFLIANSCFRWVMFFL